MEFSLHTEVSMTAVGFSYDGMAICEDVLGRRAFVWNALPSEEVVVYIYKYKRGDFYGVATRIIKAHVGRVMPREEHFLSSSPWQIMSQDMEREAKVLILTDVFKSIPEVPKNIEVVDALAEYEYRTKMEFGFHAEPTLSLAAYDRMGRGRIRVSKSALATPAVNRAAHRVVECLIRNKTLPQILKSVVVRANTKGEAIAALFVIDEINPLDETVLDDGLVGVSVYFSDPQSPASVPTKHLGSFGKKRIIETIRGKEFEFEIMSFMQINVPLFEKALERISEHTHAFESIVDMYSGVGSIGLSIDAKRRTLVEIEPAAILCARENVKRNGIEANIVESPSERARDYIVSDSALILDPPRSGLHPKVIKKILEVAPPIVVYLSCNPKSQARDIALFLSGYNVVFAEGYNFFPKTPHVECLVILKRKVIPLH
jgi:23S rRNA (uracil1939-C5)-methyltransferase